MPSNHLLCHPLLLLPSIFLSIKEVKDGAFPSGPSVKEPSFQGRGHGFEP